MRFNSNIGLIFGIWFLSIIITAYFGFVSFPNSQRFSSSFLKSFANWDGGHYIGIAEFGYTEKFQYAFFPLYPLLIRIIYSVTHDYLIAALAISISSTFIAINLLYRLIGDNFDKGVAQKTISYLIFFPTSFYFLTAYSEGLFFLLVVSTFYFLRTNRFFWATLAASLASATRLAGLAVVFALLMEVYATKGINKKNWYALLSSLGFVIYCWYLFTQTADPFYFVQAETHWLRNLSIPGVSFWESIKGLSSGYLITKNFNAFLDLAFAIFGVGMIIRAFRFLPISYSVYGLISILLPLLSSSLSSIPRFLLPIFPIFILLAFIKNQHSVFAYQLISIMLLAVFITLFMNGYWVS